MRVEIHVDASTVPGNPGHVGVGFHAQVGDQRVISWAYCGHGTSNYGEIMSIGFALSVIKPSRRDSVLVVTDSTYALKTLTGEWPLGANRAVVLAVRRKIEIYGAILDYTKGHAGQAGNEAADFSSHQGAIQGLEVEMTPVFMLDGLASPSLRRLELEVLPELGRLRPSLRQAVLGMHREIRQRKISTTGDEELVIAEALRALGMEELHGEADDAGVRDPGQEEGRAPPGHPDTRPARRLPVHRQGAR